MCVAPEAANAHPDLTDGGWLAGWVGAWGEERLLLVRTWPTQGILDFSLVGTAADVGVAGQGAVSSPVLMTLVHAGSGSED